MFLDFSVCPPLVIIHFAVRSSIPAAKIEFLEENLSEYEFINFGIKEFEREDLDKLPAEQREEILALLQQMRKRRKELLMTEEEGNRRNKKNTIRYGWYNV